MRAKNQGTAWEISRVGRPPNHLVKKPDPASKIAKLKIRMAKHIHWVDFIQAEIGKLEGKTKKPILARFTAFLEQDQ